MNHPKNHYVYMVRCANGALYTGYAQNVEQRIAAHNAGQGARYTRSHRPVELMFSWCFQTKPEALRVEYRIKQLSRQQKLELAQAQDLPGWLVGRASNDSKAPQAER